MYFSLNTTAVFNDNAQALDFNISDSVSIAYVFVQNIFILIFTLFFSFFLFFFLCFVFFCLFFFVGRISRILHLRKNMGLRKQAASHLQHPKGPAEVSRLLSVSEARV